MVVQNHKEIKRKSFGLVLITQILLFKLNMIELHMMSYLQGKYKVVSHISLPRHILTTKGLSHLFTYLPRTFKR